MKLIDMRSMVGHALPRLDLRDRLTGFFTSRARLMCLALLVLCLSFTATAMEYYAGQEYSFFSDPCYPDTDYWLEWTAEDVDGNPVGSYLDKTQCEFVWTAPSEAQKVIISLTVTNRNQPSCTDKDDYSIDILPLCEITAPDFVCEGSAGNTASVQDAGTGATYDWYLEGGQIDSGENTREITWSADMDATEVFIQVTITRAGVSNSCYWTVAVNPLPDCTITAPASVCEGSTGNMASAEFYADATYVWTVDGVEVTPPNAAEPNKILWNAPIDGASSEICVKITDANGCECQDCVEVPFDPLPECTITPPTEPICPGAKDLTASVMDAGAGATYNWWVNTEPVVCTGGCGPSITFDAPDAPGSTIPIRVVITDGKGCTAECEDSFYINERPFCDIDYYPYDICTGDTYTVSTTNLGADAHYAWSVNGVEQTIDAPTLTLTAPDTAGYVTICLVVTDGDGCQSEQCCVDVPIEACMTCETAWAYLETCINTARGSNNWGWFGIYSAAELEAGLSVPFIAAAGQCDPYKGYEVGTVTASLSEWDETTQTQTLYVDVDLNSECELIDFHVWASADPINNPIPTKGGFSKWNKDGEITFTSEVSEVLLAVHGSVCCPACEEDCIFPSQ